MRLVDSETKDYRYTYEYFVLKHASHYVMPGAEKVETDGEYDDVLAFKNPDNSVILIIANQSDENKKVTIKIGTNVISPSLEAYSVNTLKITK